ncbi:MAG: accessory factor UbiK family protein [Gammaproteobacteria bacterium]|nr:accessory factor UbiK family protein [Gammaproteobacteria bacterium]
MSNQNLPPNPLEAIELVKRVVDTAKAALPESVSADLRENLKAAIEDVIRDLETVTREELEVQKAVLAKTRDKVDRMEQTITELERRLAED